MKVQAKNQDTILDFFYSPISPSILCLSSPISSKSKINLETFTSVHLVDTKLRHSCLEDCKDPLKSLCLYASTDTNSVVFWEYKNHCLCKILKAFTSTMKCELLTTAYNTLCNLNLPTSMVILFFMFGVFQKYEPFSSTLKTKKLTPFFKKTGQTTRLHNYKIMS